MKSLKSVTVFLIMTSLLVSLTACGGEKKEAQEQAGDDNAVSVSMASEDKVAKASTAETETKSDEVQEAPATEPAKEEDTGYTLPDLSGESHEDAGYYSIYAYTENSARYTAEDLAAAGVAFDLMMCPDGTGYANFMGENYDISWKDGYLNILTKDGVEIMDYGSGNYMGRKTLSLTQEAENLDVRMSFEYAGEADSTYTWKNVASSSLKNSTDSAKASDNTQTSDKDQASDADKSQDTGKADASAESSKQEAQSAPAAPAEDVTYSFRGYKTTVSGDFVYQFFGTDSPESLFEESDGSRIHFWLVDPETGKGVADGNIWTLNHISEEVSEQAQEEATTVKDREYIGEETLGSVKAYSVKRSKEKDSEIWRSSYFEADGNKFNIAGTFKDIETLGKVVDLYVQNVKVEKE